MSRAVFLILALAAVALRAATPPEAILVVLGDLHSAYERSAQLVARVDRLRGDNPGVPLAVLLNGDTMEYGNAVARRSAGAIDFALFTALARRGPLVINFGNHEPEFHDVAETVRRLEATGAQVISGNLRDPATGQPYARASLALPLGAHTLTLVGVTTDRLSTWRVAIRPQLDLADPAVWAREHFPRIFSGAGDAAPSPRLSEPRGEGAASPTMLPVVLSHSGLRADRAMLPLVPDGTLFAGAHDHLRFVQREGRTIYFHSGSWMEFISIARLTRTTAGLGWAVEQVPLAAADPADPGMDKLVRATLAQHLTPEETAVVGRTLRALAPSEAARFAVEAARVAADADVALVGATTFGAGLPAGDVTRHAFDACVRFDGPLHAAEVSGAWLQKILSRANQGPETPFADRGGENLIAAIRGPIAPGRTYRLVTADWIAKNAKNYLGDDPPALTERKPELKLKAAVIAALNR
ncbi:MAG: 5'-nucleotidase C-terminal domain-containing protein [Opitutaceae bacterium]|nr:5'-nucleotidase C-terminal domain-containing protein [Opitutaceae bacterium]